MLRLFLSKILAIALLVAVPAPTFAAVFVGVSVRVGPPAIPYYAQPPVPRPGLLWAPGYWAWDGGDYYWVPGTWVAAPRPGFLWTPGYWAFRAGYYGWHPGYWGPRVGFYGGINYGYGYFGAGFVGGGWYRGVYRYNGAYTNVNRTIIRNVYVNKTVVNNFNASTANRVSYNGGPGGTRVTPAATDLAAANAARVAPTAAQTQHEQVAAQNKNAFAATNDGYPKDTAVSKPFDANNRPADFTPKTATADRSNVQDNATRSQSGANGNGAGDRALGNGAGNGAAAGDAHSGAGMHENSHQGPNSGNGAGAGGRGRNGHGGHHGGRGGHENH